MKSEQHTSSEDPQSPNAEDDIDIASHEDNIPVSFLEKNFGIFYVFASNIILGSMHGGSDTPNCVDASLDNTNETTEETQIESEPSFFSASLSFEDSEEDKNPEDLEWTQTNNESDVSKDEVSTTLTANASTCCVSSNSLLSSSSMMLACSTSPLPENPSGNEKNDDRNNCSDNNDEEQCALKAVLGNPIRKRRCYKLSISFLCFLVLVLIISIGLYFGLRNTNSDQETLSLLSEDDPSLPSIFRANMTGRPLEEGYDYATTSGILGGSTGIDSKNVELEHLLKLLSPTVTEISEKEGYELQDYVASKRNDVSIVVKGSPQHNALMWLSHAIVCRPTQDSPPLPSLTTFPKPVTIEETGPPRIEILLPKDTPSLPQLTSYENPPMEETEPPIEGNKTLHDCRPLLSRSQLLNRYALATLYFAWGGKSWNDSEGWLAYDGSTEKIAMSRDSSAWTLSKNWTPAADVRYPSEVCRWKGVTCQHETGPDNYSDDDVSTVHNEGLTDEVIVGISLPDNNIVGTMAAVKEIGLLTDLETLDLSKNHLRGSILEAVLVLTELRSLDLSHNQLEGVVPLGISKFIRVLRLEDNLLVDGLESGPRFESPCGNDFTELVSDCAGTKPKIVCPCCTSCCGVITDVPVNGGVLRGSKETTSTCIKQIPMSTAHVSVLIEENSHE